MTRAPNKALRSRPRRPFSPIALLLVLGLLQGACFPGFKATPTPMPSLSLVQSSPPASCTAILLPGMLDNPETFRRQKFAQLAAEKAPGLDIIAADAHFGYYRKNMILTRLHEDIVGPQLDTEKKVWLVGTSLGGIGSLLYARGKNGEVTLPGTDRLAGLILLAPFLGEDELIDEISAAGGPLKWRPTTSQPQEPGSRADVGVAAWTWLLDWHQEEGEKPRILLGWGAKDDLAPAARLAAQLLPPEDTFEIPGKHDWKVWRQLWQDMLETGVFANCEKD